LATLAEINVGNIMTVTNKSAFGFGSKDRFAIVLFHGRVHGHVEDGDFMVVCTNCDQLLFCMDGDAPSGIVVSYLKKKGFEGKS
jgi:hypothetical protein